MSELFEVSPSGYYAWRKRPESTRRCEDRQLSREIAEIHQNVDQSYGARRIGKELQERGRRCSPKRVARLMRQQGVIAAGTRPQRVTTTDSNHSFGVAPNHLEQDFTATAPNQKWAGDITYIRTAEGWLYLAVVLDLFSRKVVGWAMSSRIDQQLTRAAMMMALRQRKPRDGLIMHTDRGVQYAASEYRRLLADWSVRPSMSRRGNCYDNAVSESFFARLKQEVVHRMSYRTRQEARRSIFRYIEVFYNRQRRHSRLGYLSPERFEQLYFTNNPCPL
jgi:putative transposase